MGLLEKLQTAAQQELDCGESWGSSPGSPQSHTVWRGARASDLGQAFQTRWRWASDAGGIAQGDRRINSP